MSIPSGIGAFRGDIESLRGRKDPEAVKAVAKELEAIFAYELIKAMRQTAELNKESGFGREAYMGMFDMELSRLFAERGIGIQDQLVRALTRKESAEKTPAAPGAPGSKPPTEAPPAPAADDRVRKAYQEGFLPADGRVSSDYGMRRHPIHGDHRFHHGVDIAAPEGTEVRAVRPGKVVFSGVKGGYGNMVIIDHGEGITTKYAHNKVNLVREGDEVAAGSVIGKIGTTGASTGPHLHFQVSVNGRDTDPAKVLAML